MISLRWQNAIVPLAGLGLGLIPALALAQAPTTPSQSSGRPAATAPRAGVPAQPGVQAPRTNVTTRSALRPTQYRPELSPFIPTDPNHPDYHQPTHRSYLRANPLPYRSSSTWGFRNPGGVGRDEEYYPPGNEFQNPGGPHVAGQFDTNSFNNRSEQAMAYNAGTARYNSIQSNINTYGRPFGFYGFGYGGGAMYGMPY